MIKILQSTKTLWFLFALLVLETLGFLVIMHVWDFHIIDEMSDPGKIIQYIEKMSETQRYVHAVTTATLDVVYPLTYGALFAGLALKAYWPILSVPSILVVPVDLIEGGVQILALNGHMELLWLKAYVTPLKLALSVGAAVIALCAVIKLWRGRRLKTQPPS